MNFTQTSANSSYNIISWEEPSTLNITNIEPDIFGYTICVMTQVGDLDTGCINTTKRSIVILKYFTNVNLTLSAWNIVGESKRIIHVIEPCIFTTPEQIGKLI